MDLREAINDPDIAESFDVLRSQGGSFQPGGWVEPAPQTIKCYGIISEASAREVKMLPEADRILDNITIHTETPLFVTRIPNAGTVGQGTSDIVIYEGDQYRIMKVYNYSTRGFYWAIAVRMAGA